MNIISLNSKISCGKFSTISYSFTQQKIFFSICALIFGCLCILIGVFKKKQFMFATTITAGAFFIFFFALSCMSIQLSNEGFYLIFTASTCIIFFYNNLSCCFIFIYCSKILSKNKITIIWIYFFIIF